MARRRPTPHPPRRRTEPPTAGIRPVGKDSHPNPRIPLGARTAPLAGSAFAPDSALQADNGCRTGAPAHYDCERRRIYTCHGTVGRGAGCRRGMLRTMARGRDSKRPRSVRVAARQPRRDGVHAAEAVAQEARRAHQHPSVSHGYRHLAALRPCGEAAHEEIYECRRHAEELRHVFRIRLCPRHQPHYARRRLGGAQRSSIAAAWRRVLPLWNEP